MCERDTQSLLVYRTRKLPRRLHRFAFAACNLSCQSPDNETDPPCVLQCCDCQNRSFSSGQMREVCMQICIAKRREGQGKEREGEKGRERERRKIEEEKQEENKRSSRRR